MENDTLDNNPQNVIFIIGCTGTGKSKLAIELARKWNGEVVNADSMQVYKGLDIATNKITKDESMGVQHHLIGFMDVTDTTFNSSKEITQRGALPIVVGGTHFYVEELIFSKASLEADHLPNDLSPKEIPKVPKESLYTWLSSIDSTMADKLHPNDTRKLQRCLEIYHQTGMKPSQYFIQKNSSKCLRYNPCVLWLDCEADVLEVRLNKRIDQMVQRGLLEELITLHTLCKQHSLPSDVLSHGYKEFIPYLDLEESRDTPLGHSILDQCIEKLKSRTRNYAKKQLTWINNRLLPSEVNVYRLDSSDLDNWEQRVYQCAMDITHAFLHGSPISGANLINASKHDSDGKQEPLGKWKKYVCQTCNNRALNGTLEWEAHLRSKAHKQMIKKARIKKQET